MVGCGTAPPVPVGHSRSEARDLCPAQSCPLNHRPDHRGYPQLWTSERAPFRNRPVWPSDPGVGHELHACKLPTVWITPVDNSSTGSGRRLPAAPGGGRRALKRARRTRPAVEKQEPAVGDPKNGLAVREPKDQPPRGGSWRLLRLRTAVRGAAPQERRVRRHDMRSARRGRRVRSARRGRRECGQRGAAGAAPRRQATTRRAETAISRARTKSRPPACRRP